jgi:acetyl/propionyl-CoA carboxylase alpha subunit
MKTKLKNNSKDLKSMENDMEEKDFQILVVHEGHYKTLYTKKYVNRKKWVKPDDKLILSFIPGSIKQLMVKDNLLVKKGDPLLILEAMKMENTLFAQFDGKIKKVYVNAGDKVPKGKLIIEFE